MEPKKIVNEEEQNEPLNPTDNDYENTDDKLKGYKEGNHDDSTSGDGQNGLPGQDDDSGKTIRETPKMNNQ